MKLSIFGKELIVGETDKKGRKVVIGVIDSKKGRGSGIYTDPDIIFESIIFERN